jgi:ribosomal protein S18 acetylase RimI-like enzyme
MITLLPIEQADYDIFLEQEIVGYAEDKVKSGNWQPEEALEKSRADFQHYLPDGPRSKDQFVYTIFNEETQQKLGVLWVQVKMDEPRREAFILDFVIDEKFRGKGFGKQALSALDEKLMEMGSEFVGLHVFGHNTNAFELYKKMGYEVTNINMRKVYKK